MKPSAISSCFVVVALLWTFPLQHASLQALRDALDIRALLFEAMPQTEMVNVRVFRETVDYKR